MCLLIGNICIYDPNTLEARSNMPLWQRFTPPSLTIGNTIYVQVKELWNIEIDFENWPILFCPALHQF